MAVDKLVDSTQLDADLTSVANAIRAKGGTSAQMAFPAGFVSAVNAIPTGGGGNKPGTWNRPNYVPDITDFVVEQENTVYISCENTPANKADTNSRIYCPFITSVDVTVFHDDGTTETQTITDYGFTSGTNSYIQMAKMPLGNILIKMAPDKINCIPINDYGTNISIYEIYVFGSQSASANLRVVWSNKSYLLHLFIKKVKFTDSFKCAYVTNPIYVIKRIAYLFEFYDCDFSEVTSFSQCTTQSYCVDYTFAPLNLSNACTIFDYAFSEFGGKSLDLSQCDLSGATNTTGMFRQYQRSNAQLSDLRMWKAPMISFDISPLPNLTVESLMSVINALQAVSTTQTITLGTTLRNKLTAEQIAIATAKGWTVA